MLDTNIETQVMKRVRANANSGIWPHSRPDTYFIYCVGQNPIQINAFMTWAYSQGVGIKPLVGQYNGQSERSFISNYKDFESIRPWLNEEESILHIGRSNRQDHPEAILEYLATGEREELGRLVPVTREKALVQSCWTFDPLSNTYFITEKC